MKITCEYCGSYVEPTDNGKCPSCSAALGDSIKAQQEREKREAEEKERIKEEKLKAEREQAKKEKEDEELFEFGKEVVRTVLGGGSHANPVGRAKYKVSNFFFKFKRAIKRILITAGIIFIIYLVIKFGHFTSLQDFLTRFPGFYA